MADILVAGGAGFIGSHLCDALLGAGHAVWALDNFATGRRENVAHLAENPHFHLVETDITRPLPPELPTFARIYHLASPASPNATSPRSYMQLPLETAAVNTIGTQLLLERARQDGARILFASTSEIYGDPLVHPQREEYRGNVNTLGPRAIYDEAKRFGETLMIAYWRRYGTDARLIRIFNTYGERMDPDDGRAVVNFAAQALRGEPLTIYGDGSQTRSLCYVTDLVRGIVAVMEGEGLAGEVFNLGNPDERTMIDLAHAVMAACEIELPLAFYPMPPDDPTRRCPDITKARHLLGWQPTIPLEEGLTRLIAAFKRELDRPADATR